MTWLCNAMKSSIGAKIVMAITGLMLVGFLAGHLAGNLLIFAGPDAINAYAQGLHDLGGLLWVARIGLLVAVALHIVSGIRVSRANKAAKPQKYAIKNHVKTTFAQRAMYHSGIVIFLFIVLHLAHYTFRMNPEFKDLDVYSMVVQGFQFVPASLFYIFAIILIFIHLSHGISSSFQSLGLNHPKYNTLFRCAGPLLSTIFAVGFISIPVAVLLGILK